MGSELLPESTHNARPSFPMPWFHETNNAWTETDDAPDGGLGLHVQASDPDVSPEVHVVKDGDPLFHLTGIDPRPQTDTTHTVAHVDPSSKSGTHLFAVHAEANDLIFEDLRSKDEKVATDEAIDHVQSALNEILVPVYIDDVVSELSERVPGLAILHTAQYERKKGRAWTYFRTSVFQNGDLALEDEYGSLSA
jgi:hypothetical protein